MLLFLSVSISRIFHLELNEQERKILLLYGNSKFSEVVVV